MGMFDELRCAYPLPVEGANACLYQTKDTPSQSIDLYEIREDGSLWHEEYETEDISDPATEGLAALFGCMTRVRNRFVREHLTGEIRFYHYEPRAGIEWIEFSAYFIDGWLKHLVTIEHRLARGIDSGEAGQTPKAAGPEGQEPGHAVTRLETSAERKTE